MNKKALLPLFLLWSILSKAQHYPNHNLEFGSGYSFLFEGDLHIPVYGKWVYSPYVNSELGVQISYNALHLGDEADFTYGYRSGLNRRPIQVAAKNMLFLELFGYRRLRLFKKQRFLGLGLQAGYSKANYDILIKPNSFEAKGNVFKAIHKTVNFNWQEQSRNVIHKFQLQVGFYNNEDVDLKQFHRNFSYTVGYRFPTKKVEEPDNEDLIGWRSILIDTSFSYLNLGIGFDIFQPVNSEAQYPSFAFYGELRARINRKYDIGILGNILKGRGLFAYDNLPTLSYDRPHLVNISGEMSQYLAKANYYFITKEFDLFAGIGIGAVHRRAIYNGPRGVRNEPRFNSRLNLGGQISVGYQLGKVRHSLAFNLAGKEIPDFISMNLGVNLGLGVGGKR